MKILAYLCFAFMLLVLSANTAFAGVTTRLSGTTLHIKGDGAGDWVTVQGIGVNGVVDVHVNWSWPVRFSNVRNIKIDMGAGTDSLVCQQVVISGNLAIDLGGDFGDQYFVMNSFIQGSLNGSGASDADVTTSLIGKSLTLSSSMPFDIDGDGFTLSLSFCTVIGNTAINGSDEADLIGVLDNALKSRTIKMGDGNDDAILSNNSIQGNHSIDGGRGFDSMAELESSVSGRTSRRNMEFILL